MKKTVAAFLLIVSTILCKAQALEVGLLGGFSNYMGDLAPKMFIPEEFHPAAGLVCRVNLNTFLTLRGGTYFGRLSGSDADHNGGSDFRIRRNLSFRSDIYEASIAGEFNIFGYRAQKFIGRKITPYILAGVGIVRFNPKTEYAGQWVELQPLGTEGQGLEGYPKPYSLNVWVFPLGGGIRYAVNEHWNLAFDFAARKSTTDYLDDISAQYADTTLIGNLNGHIAAVLSDRSGEILGENFFNPGKARGNPKNDDWYILSGFTITYTFIRSYHGKKNVGRPRNPWDCFGFHR